MNRLKDRRWVVITAWMGLCSLTGCDPSKTETGYTPRRVGMGNAELRSLYAPAFSPEAKAAEESKKPDVSTHRPGT